MTPCTAHYTLQMEASEQAARLKHAVQSQSVAVHGNAVQSQSVAVHSNAVVTVSSCVTTHSLLCYKYEGTMYAEGECKLPNVIVGRFRSLG
jgi:hypothetical protein